MTHNRFTVLDEIQRHPDLAEQTAQAVQRVAPTVKEMTDHRALDLLFELTQQAARFRSGTDPWASLAMYDADGFAAFTTRGAA